MLEAKRTASGAHRRGASRMRNTALRYQGLVICSRERVPWKGLRVE